jgi:hypothetical protein
VAPVDVDADRRGGVFIERSNDEAVPGAEHFDLPDLGVERELLDGLVGGAAARRDDAQGRWVPQTA